MDLFLYFAFADNVTQGWKKKKTHTTLCIPEELLLFLCLRRNAILKNNLFNFRHTMHRLEHHLHTTNLIKALNTLVPAVSIKAFWSLSAVVMDVYSTLCIFKPYTFGSPQHELTVELSLLNEEYFN